MSHFIILGDSTGDVELLARMSCGKEGDGPWGCPKEVCAGDTALLYIPHVFQAIKWTATFREDAVPGTERDLDKYPWAAKIGDVTQLPGKGIPLKTIRSVLPEDCPWCINCRFHYALSAKEAEAILATVEAGN